MKSAALAMTVMGLLAASALAQEPVTSNRGYTTTPWGAIVPVSGKTSLMQRSFVKQPGPAMGGCEACYASSSYPGERMERLWSFLFFRPSIPCDWCPRPSEWSPPLYMWFPNRCNAIGGCGNAVCTRGWLLGPPQGGCSACGASLGMPIASRQGVGANYQPVGAMNVTQTSMKSQRMMNIQSSARYPQPNLLPPAMQPQASPYAPMLSQPLPNRP